MNSYFAYTRVSTAKQGEHGVSLQEQKSAIAAFASRSGFHISRWFEERETAAKRGRPVFDKMMALLQGEGAVGVIIHKIDRSARNLRDWSDLGELIDSGIEVHFANESLDLHSRGGRLSADIQAVVASDYIRNLREETKKGMRGRYKQGLFPLPAPIGYQDQGSGMPKTIDPIQGPLVKRMFEMYASGRYGHQELSVAMYGLGLRTKRGQRVEHSTISWMLRNPFYYGAIRLKTTGEMFEGVHSPLISRSLFLAARDVSEHRLNKRYVKHDLYFRRSVRCAKCGYNLVGERSKGFVYYRCHSLECPTNSIREDQLDKQIRERLTMLTLDDDEKRRIDDELKDLTAESSTQRADMIRSVEATIGNLRERLSRLADAYLDGILDRSILQAKQNALLAERADLEEKLADLKARDNLFLQRLRNFIDFAGNTESVYRNGNPITRQQILRKVAARIAVADKIVTLTFNPAFSVFAKRARVRGTECDGVSTETMQSSNDDPDPKWAIATNQNTLSGDLLVKPCESGCPPQDTLRTLLIEIGNELIAGDNHQSD